MAKFSRKDKEITRSGSTIASTPSGESNDAAQRRSTSGGSKVPASLTGSPSSFKVFNESTSATDDRLGFINRDELVTERIRVPMVANPMGRNFTPIYSNISVEQPASATPSGEEVAVWYENWNGSVPGIMSLDLEYSPVTSGTDHNITSDIFLAKWIDIRQLDNMVKNWQPGDPCVVELGLMIIRAQMAFIRRCLEIMRDVYQDSTNLYYSPVALLRASGFYGTEYEIRTMYERFWQYYNQTLVGTLNNVKWMTGNPGHFRWASLFRDIYKDNPAKTNYTQTMLFRPAHTYYLTTEEDGWHLKRLRSINQYLAIDASASDPDHTPLSGFATFMHDTYALIRALFYDDSTQDMLATLNAIAIRGKTGGNIGDVSELHFDRLAFESDKQFALTFDLQMCVAIQNATICKGTNSSDITVDPKTGNISQTIYATSNAGLGTLARIAKVINMPTFTPTQADMFNATQWTIVATNDKKNSAQVPYANYGSPGIGFASGTFATDFITGCTLYNLQSNGSNWIVIDPSTVKAIDITGMVLIHADSEYSQDEMLDEIRKIQSLQQFAFAPMIYLLRENLDMDPSWYQCLGPIVQSEVLFVGDASTLGAMHTQWHRNFWGYPSHIDGAIGTPTFDVKGITERDPLS